MGQASLNSYIFQELIFQDLELSEVWSYSQVQWVGQIDELQLVKILLEEHTKKKKKTRTIIFGTSVLKFKRRVVWLTHLPLFVSKVVQFCYVANKVTQAHLVGNLMAKILKDNYSNQEFLTY